ncbi:MAG: Tn3 family transposase [Acidobacteriota bacterium]|nr:Tn3 family transposase [Acidobacteriota bacterium]
MEARSSAALVFQQRARSFDDAGEMFIRQVRKIEARASDILKQRQAEYMQQTTGLVRTLRDVALAFVSEGTGEERLRAIGSLLEPDIGRLLQQCEEHAALVSGNHIRLMPSLFRHARAALLLLLEHLPLEPTTQDDCVHKAIAFVLANKSSRAELLPVSEGAPGSGRKNSALNLSFVPEPWWTLVTRTKNRSVEPTHVDRQFFELCVLSQVATDLKSNDLCIPLGTKLGDYRERLVPWDTYHREVITYGERMNIPVRPQDFVARLRADLDKTARAADESFPDNRYLRVENGEPVLSPVRADPDPAGLSRMEQLLKERMEPVEILDALVDTEHWLNWTRYFSPLSGFDAKVKRPRERYVLTVFCYGSNLGPVQTARSVRGTDRFKLAFINQRHVTEASLNDAITTVVNAYAQFPLQRLWGTGKSASADGMKWDLYPQNLMSEYHIRYGGYGGIGYYLLADSYIALVSRFTTCGSWEGHYILDFLKENESDVRPDTIHADTQGQSTAIFGLAYLLGIQLMPRIRNWKDQHLFRPSPASRYEHIDELFTAQVDWVLIETMAPDMLRVAVSIQTGTMLPSDILRRLASASRKNKLYFALRELGRVVRTMFLLRYASDLELRHTIQTATTKSERFNRFVQWVSFGGDSVIAENVRDEQRKFIKYNHLVANLLVFHNLVAMTRAIGRMETDGHQISDEILAVLSPYQTSHINRFGNYSLNFGRDPEPVHLHFRKPPQSEPSPKVILMPVSKVDLA